MLAEDVRSVSFLASASLCLIGLLYSSELYASGFAIDMFTYSITWNNSSLFLAFACGLCAAPNVVRDLSTRSSLLQIARLGKRRYVCYRFGSCFLSTATAVFLAVGVFALVCAAGGQAIASPYQLEIHNYAGPFSDLIYRGHYALWFLAIALAVGGCYGVFGCIGLACSTVIENRFIAISSPFIVSFFWAKLRLALALPSWADFTLFAKCRWQVPDLAQCIGGYVAMILVVLLVVFLLYFLSMKHRLTEG